MSGLQPVTFVKWVLMLTWLAACGQPTEALVVLTMEPSLAPAARTLEIEVRTQEGDPVMEERHVVTGLPGDGEVRFPATIPIIPRGGDAARHPTFRAALLDEAGLEISHVETVVRFTEGELTTIELIFEEDEIVEPPMLPQARFASVTDFSLGSAPLVLPAITGQPGIDWLLLLSVGVSLPDEGIGWVTFCVNGRPRSTVSVQPGAERIWRVVDSIGVGLGGELELRSGNGCDGGFELGDVLVTVEVEFLPLEARFLTAVEGEVMSGNSVLANLSLSSANYVVAASASLFTNSRLTLSNGTMTWSPSETVAGTGLQSALIVVSPMSGEYVLRIDPAPTPLVGVQNARVIAFPSASSASFPGASESILLPQFVSR